MFRFNSFVCPLLFGWCVPVIAEVNYPDFDNPIEILKIKNQAVVGKWTEFTNKSLPFNEFRQINGLQYLRLVDYPFNGYYLQEDEMKKIRSLRHFKNGLLQGPVITWRENGLKFHQGFYKKGLKDGLYEYWSKNNIKILEQNFKNGKLDGLTVKRYQNGLKSSEQIFQDGKIITAIGWKPNGDRCPSTRVMDGVGVLVMYDDFETETTQDEFKINTENRTIERYENGNIREQGYYKNKKKDGLWIFYKMDGSEHFRVNFRNGIRMKTEFSSNPMRR